MNILKLYATELKTKESTPKQLAEAFVMQEIADTVKAFKSEYENNYEKRFIIALAKFHNKIGDKFKGDYLPIEIDEI